MRNINIETEHLVEIGHGDFPCYSRKQNRTGAGAFGRIILILNQLSGIPCNSERDQLGQKVQDSFWFAESTHCIIRL